jgi:hypothetical protein
MATILKGSQSIKTSSQNKIFNLKNQIPGVLKEITPT